MATIQGTAGRDQMVGTAQSDVFVGGARQDTFVWDARVGGQADVVADFGSFYFNEAITAAQEVPPNGFLASGTVNAILNRAQTALSYGAIINGLDLGGVTASTADDVTAAHFHRAPVGASGPVVFGFFGAPNNETGGDTVVLPGSSTVAGRWNAGEGNGTTLTALLPGLLAGEIYINFHTAAFPAGVIRGQLTPVDFELDRIDVTASGASDLETLQQLMSEAGGSTSLTSLSNGLASVLTLQGVSMASLAARDFLFADGTARQLFGSAGADVLVGSSSADTLSGGDGADRLLGGEGDDILDGGAGGDSLMGLGGADRLFAGAGNDTANGNKGDDNVAGGDGDDLVRGGQGADTVQGEAGADTVSGDRGADLLFGGAGADRFLLQAGFGTDTVADFNAAQGDRVQLSPGTAFTVANVGGQAAVTLAGGDSIVLTGVAFASFTNDLVVFG